MASYHLSVKTVKRSVGRTATAAAAYRAGERLSCDREGRVHDYTRKQGIESTFILLPSAAPDWASDRASLWNAVEDRETRRNSVTAREWELALPSELSAEGRAALARDFAQALVDRYSIAADVAVHAPHREGDQRNHHAHILTSTRVLAEDGFTDKTRILDAAKTGGVEIEEMRGLWAQMQNHALERAGQDARVDHRSLEDQREAALDRGDDIEAATLDRDAEIKLGPAASSMERKALREAARDGTDYVPVTERGAQVHETRQQRSLLLELKAFVVQAHDAYNAAREANAGRLQATADAARALFAAPQMKEFGATLQRTFQSQEEARQKALEADALERERQAALRVERADFIENTAIKWQDCREIQDPQVAERVQNKISADIQSAMARFACSFDDLADPINARADEIADARDLKEALQRRRDGMAVRKPEAEQEQAVRSLQKWAERSPNDYMLSQSGEDHREILALLGKALSSHQYERFRQGDLTAIDHITTDPVYTRQLLMEVEAHDRHIGYAMSYETENRMTDSRDFLKEHFQINRDHGYENDR